MRVILGFATCLGVWGLGCSAADFSAAAVKERMTAEKNRRKTEYIEVMEDVYPKPLIDMKAELKNEEFAMITINASLYADPAIVTVSQYLNDLKTINLGSGDRVLDNMRHLRDNMLNTFWNYNEILDAQHRANTSLYESNHIEKEFQAMALYTFRSKAVHENPSVQELLSDNLVRSYYTPFYSRKSSDRIFAFITAIVRANEHEPKQKDLKDNVDALFEIEEVKIYLNGVTQEEISEFLHGNSKLDTLYKIASIGAQDPQLLDLFRTIPEALHANILENATCSVFSMTPTLLKAHIAYSVYQHSDLSPEFNINGFISHGDLQGDATLESDVLLEQQKMSLSSYEACPYATRLSKVLHLKYNIPELFPHLYRQGSPEVLRKIARSIRQFAGNPNVDFSVIIEVELKSAIYHTQNLNIVEKKQKAIFEDNYQVISEYGKESDRFYKEENDTWNLAHHLPYLALESEETLLFYEHFQNLADDEKQVLQDNVKDLTRDVNSTPIDQYYFLVGQLVKEGKNLPKDTIAFFNNEGLEYKINKSSFVDLDRLYKGDLFYKFIQVAFAGRYDADTMIGIFRNFPKSMQVEMINNVPTDFKQSPSANTQYLAKAVKNLKSTPTESINILEAPSLVDAIKIRPQELAIIISAKKYDASKIVSKDPNYFRNVNATPTANPEPLTPNAQDNPKLNSTAIVVPTNSQSFLDNKDNVKNDIVEGDHEKQNNDDADTSSSGSERSTDSEQVVPIPANESSDNGLTKEPGQEPEKYQKTCEDKDRDGPDQSGKLPNTDKSRESGAVKLVPVIPLGEQIGVLQGEKKESNPPGESGVVSPLPGTPPSTPPAPPLPPQPLEVKIIPSNTLEQTSPGRGLEPNVQNVPDIPSRPLSTDPRAEGNNRKTGTGGNNVVPSDTSTEMTLPGSETSTDEPTTPAPSKSCSIGTFAKTSIVVIALLGIAAGAAYFIYPPKKGEKPQDYVRRLAEQAKLLPKKAKAFFKSDQLLEEASPPLMDREDFM